LGITAAFQITNLGITGSELARLNEPDSSARAYTLTFDPTVRFSLSHGMTGYLLGGGGFSVARSSLPSLPWRRP
jgi:hypothetical protein